MEMQIPVCYVEGAISCCATDEFWSRYQYSRSVFLSFLPIGITARSVSAMQCTTSVTHVVQSGETLSSIAAKYGVSEASIAVTNGISDPNRIYAGQRLVISSCAGAPAPVPGTGSSGQVVHVVQSGETLSSIAAKYGVSEASIAATNGISDPNRIYAGQRLTIPSSGGVASTPDYVGGAKYIQIDLSDQWIYAYEGSTLILSSGVSTGRPGWDTPVGEFKIYAKYPFQTMRGSANGRNLGSAECAKRDVLLSWRCAARHILA